MPLVIVAIGVALLLLLMIRFKMNGFIALVLVALAVGLMQGMPLDKVIVSIKNGVGGTLGSLALIMGFGAMLGKLLADCGGAQRIATTLIAKFGKKHIQWAVVLTGFTVGFALFYEVGFVLMLPLVFTIAASARIPLLYVGVPMAAALSVTHGFLPPHPGPTAIATIFHADMGKTLLYGTILAIPTVILADPVFARFLKGIDKPIPEGLHNPKTFTEEEMPGFGVSVWALTGTGDPDGDARRCRDDPAERPRLPAGCRVLRRPGNGDPDCGSHRPVHLRPEPWTFHGADQRHADLFDQNYRYDAVDHRRRWRLQTGAGG